MQQVVRAANFAVPQDVHVNEFMLEKSRISVRYVEKGFLLRLSLPSIHVLMLEESLISVPYARNSFLVQAM